MDTVPFVIRATPKWCHNKLVLCGKFRQGVVFPITLNIYEFYLWWVIIPLLLYPFKVACSFNVCPTGCDVRKNVLVWWDCGCCQKERIRSCCPTSGSGRLLCRGLNSHERHWWILTLKGRFSYQAVCCNTFLSWQVFNVTLCQKSFQLSIKFL